MFGLPSILLIFIFLLGFAVDQAVLFEEVRSQLQVVVGEDSADILVTVTENYKEQAAKNIWNMIIYSVTIFLPATQLIVFFQDILNDLWQIKPNFRKFWQKQLVERGLTF